MKEPACVGIVAGSGICLDALLDHVTARRPFAEFPDLDACSVDGHEGCFVAGDCSGHKVVVQNGRFHFYEGLDYASVTKPIDVMKLLGVQKVILTNAVGGLVPDLAPGSLFAVKDLATWPFRHWPGAPKRIATDFVVPGCDAAGAYFWVPGPNYETPAEIRALRALGGHVVGMSAAPEVCRCRELGLPVAVVACVTNNCCAPERLTHDHVLETASDASARLVRLLRGFLETLESV